MRFDKPPIFVLTGPTSVGKTRLSFELFERWPQIEIVSVDSAMIYRGMDIGTAKPSSVELAQIPHHLIDIRDPKETYSVAEFCEDCRLAVQSIFARGKLPLLVGGTMMYLNALRQGLAPIPSVDPSVRFNLQAICQSEGLEPLYHRLKEKDPISAARLKPSDTQRILRALEVVESTGKSLESYWGKNQPIFENPLVFLGMNCEDRSVLHQRIADRVTQMLAQGLIEEVRKLYERGDLHASMPSMRSVGYRQIWQYFSEQLIFEDLHEKITISTRQLAKRQITWMRSWADLTWISQPSEGVDFFNQFFRKKNS